MSSVVPEVRSAVDTLDHSYAEAVSKKYKISDVFTYGETFPALLFQEIHFNIQSPPTALCLTAKGRPVICS